MSLLARCNESFLFVARRRGTSVCVLLCAFAALSSCSLERISLLETDQGVAGSDSSDANSGGSDSVNQAGASAGGGLDAGGGTGGQGSMAGAPGAGGASATGGMAPVVAARVLLVVDENPISTDQAVESRLQGLGAEVTRISELMVKPEDVEGFDLFIVSPSADRVDTPTSLNQVAVPMLLLEPAVTAKLGFGALAYEADQNSGNVLQPTHALAANKSGTVLVCSEEISLQGTKALASASVIDSAGGTHSLLFVHEKGETVGMELPEARVGLSMIKSAPCQTEASWQFFDAAVHYLLGD